MSAVSPKTFLSKGNPGVCSMIETTTATSRWHRMNLNSLKSNRGECMARPFLCEIILCVCGLVGLGAAQTQAPAPCGPVPSENKMRWQEMEYYAFVHFSL